MSFKIIGGFDKKEILVDEMFKGIAKNLKIKSDKIIAKIIELSK